MENGELTKLLLSAIREGRSQEVRSLIKSQKLLKIKDCPLVYEAVDNGNMEIIQMVLEKGADIEASDSKGLTPLHLAVFRENEKIVKLLLSRGANVHAEDVTGKPCIRRAVEKLHMGIIEQLLIHGADVNYKYPKGGGSFLHFALDNDLWSLTNLLLKFDADVDALKTDGSTPLHIAVKKGNLPYVKKFIQHGANVNAALTCVSRRGETPLHLALKKGHLKMAKFLLDSGADISAIDVKGSPLRVACRTGNVEAVKFLLKEGAEFSAEEKESTPLHVAFKEGRLNVVQLLLKNGADVNAEDYEGTPLFFACKTGSLHLVKFLLEEGADLNAMYKGVTPFYAAFLEGHTHVLKFLKEIGADVNKGGDGSPLHVACRQGNLRHVKWLLRYGADVNGKSHDGTPLQIACKKNYLQVIRILLKRGADINAADNDGSLLHFSFKEYKFKLTKILLENGIDVNIMDGNGYTMLQVVVEKSNVLMVERILKLCPDVNNESNRKSFYYALKRFGPDYEKIVKMLFQYGFSVKPEDAASPELLHQAIKKGCYEIVEALLKYGANVNEPKGTTKETPLHTAARRQPENIVKLLLDSGADVNAKCNQERTPLFGAVKMGLLKNVEMFLKCGAEIDARDSAGKTPLHIAVDVAVYYGQDVIKHLLDHGANVNAKCKDGRTPLFSAADNGLLRVVEVLLKYGARIDSENPYQTAIQTAFWNKHVLKSLLEYDFTNLKLVTRPEEEDPSFFAVHAGLTHHKAETTEILAHHFVRMKAAGLLSGPQSAMPTVYGDGLIVNEFQDKCEAEIARAKCERIGKTNVTFYNILTDNVDRLACYARNHNVLQVLRSDDYKARFPMYASIIHCQFQKGEIRKALLEQGIKYFSVFFKAFSNLPHDLKEVILKFMTDRDLRVLISLSKRILEEQRKC